MTISDIPIDQLNTEQLLALRRRIDERLDVLRSAFIDQAAVLGLVVTNGDGKKRKPRANAHKQAD